MHLSPGGKEYPVTLYGLHKLNNETIKSYMVQSIHTGSYPTHSHNQDYPKYNVYT